MYRRREIAIDLTALLDVILIILFMFVVRSTAEVTTSTENNDKVKNETQQVKLLKEENANLKKQITTNSVLDDTCMVLTIFVENEEEDNNKRKLNIKTDTTEVEQVEYNWDNIPYAKNKLKDRLKTTFEEVKDTNQMILIVFQYNKNKIFNTDYKFVDSVLKDISDNKEDIYLAYYDTADKKIVD